MDKTKGLPVLMLFETSKEEFFKSFDAIVCDLVNEGEPFSNDDVRKRLVTEPRESNWHGAAMTHAIAEFKLIEVGYGKSRTRSRNGGRRILWAPAPKREEVTP